MRQPFAICLFTLLAVAGAAAAEPELAQRARIQHEAQMAFIDEDYRKLDAMHREFLEGKSRTPSGIWKLSVFHSALGELLSDARRSPMREPQFATYERRLQRWMKQFPESPAPRIVHALLLGERGWAIRGGGYAHTVPAEAWAPFQRYIAQSRQYLEEHKALASKDPRWYQAMLQNARAESWDEARYQALLDEALAREPLFYQTYFEALENLLPKWHGDAERIERFALDAVERTAAQEGRGMYARIYWFAAQTEYGNDLFAKSRAAWPRMKEGFDDVVARYPDPWNLNNFAKFACLASDKATTKALLERIGKDVVPAAWDPPPFREECAIWASKP
ncbi:MAG: hypothetical protein AB7P08_19115 [Burkholderiales bacterium]